MTAAGGVVEEERLLRGRSVELAQIGDRLILGELVRGIVEEALNAMLAAEAARATASAATPISSRSTPGPTPPSCRHRHPSVAAGRRRTEPAITDRLITDRRGGEFCLGTSGEIQIGIFTHHARDPATNRVASAFPNGQSCLHLAAGARLRHIAGTTQRSTRKYMNMAPLCAAKPKPTEPQPRDRINVVMERPSLEQVHWTSCAQMNRNSPLKNRHVRQAQADDLLHGKKQRERKRYDTVRNPLTVAERPSGSTNPRASVAEGRKRLIYWLRR
jgi:hypothetical protein